MSVLVDNRKETTFAVRDNALNMRRQITELAFRRFGKKPRKLPKQPSNWEIWSEQSKENWTKQQEEKRKQAEQFDEWFIQNERAILDRLIRKIIFNIDTANCINPQYLNECDKIRDLQDEAIGLCSNLIRELNYIGDTIPSNKNFIVITVEIINKEIGLLHGWRKSYNETRSRILEKEIGRRKTAAEKAGFVLCEENG